MILIKSISRFARNTVDCLNYIRLLKGMSIPVFFEKESIDTMDARVDKAVPRLIQRIQQIGAISGLFERDRAIRSYFFLVAVR